MKTSQRWSREIVGARVANHNSLVYSHRPKSLFELLVDARRWVDRTVVVQGELRLTNREFETAVSRTAYFLAARGIVRGDRVMLLSYNRLEWLVSFWALQCLGAVAVLGSSMWSEAEICNCMKLIEPAMVITDRESSVAIQSAERVVGMEQIRQLVSAEAPLLPPVPLSDMEDEPALIMFTSGTTGAPKGVVISHRSIIANIQNLLVLTGRLPDQLSLSAAGTVSLLSMPLFHLGGIQISILTLLTGGTLVLLEGRFDPVSILKLIEKEKVRVWGGVPTMVSRVVEHECFAEFDTSSVRSIPMGGAAISLELRAKVQKAFPAIKKRVGSLYGMTEAGGVLAAGSSEDVAGRPGCVGRLLPVVEVQVADADGDGVGEIKVRTPTITSGYFRDPTPIVDSDGWLSTGDRGRLDPDGYLYILGRSKDIIIRGGENIACAHVEHCLLQHEGVLEVAVLPLPHPDLGEEVGAVVVIRPGMVVTVDVLRAHANGLLGRHEVPTRWWLRLEPLPTNATGKISKREVLEQWQKTECSKA
ncbi:class I adenylate-forming enzyme family protein [Paraburkholderia sp. RL17-347-BIC-D]|uniref:class I adenylate-forming enzyme family protein n=1 Tax=Paraburkholderia sp. RL17-347-BIC-D TaxID=3031632 RepID=UPI0038B87DF1